MPYRPALRIVFSTLNEMSVSRPRPLVAPRAAAAIPAHMPSSATSAIRSSAGSVRPTPTVMAASPCQPCRIAPQSSDTRSPSSSTCRAAGMPCTTCSFTEAQIDAGKP
jgi:hypothetical protein